MDPLFVNWNPDPVLFRIGGVAIRYYSLFFAIGILVAWHIIHKVYRFRGIPEKKFDPLLIYGFFGIFIGARLGHCFFYEPAYYFSHPLEIVLPFKDTPQGWKFIGYEGLASHGGTIGLIVALWLYVRKTGLNFVDVLDFIAIATPFAGGCIRMGNLMNGEIVGKITDVPWAFLFAGYEGPRHPAQLYEAIAYFIMFAINMWLYKKYYKTGKLHRGFFFGLTIAMIFTFRFFIEFLKEVQVDFESDMALNMGQWLSVPFVILGVACAIGGRWLDTLSGKLEYKEKKLK